MTWDFNKWDQQSKARTDQSLAVFRDYFFSLEDEQRATFRDWVNQISKPFADSLDTNATLAGKLGWCEDRFVECTITAQIGKDKATIEPQILRQAVEAWSKAEEFCYEETW